MGKNVETSVKEPLVRKAVAALITHLGNEQAKKSKQLLEDDDTFHLVVVLKKAPEKASNKPIRIEIPNPLFEADSADVCLFVKDHKGEGHKAAKERIKSQASCGVTKVMGLSKLKSDYYPFEAKRKLCDSYDLFLADDRVIPSLPKLLGKSFFKKKKQPIPVNLNRRDWAAQIKKALNATHTFLSEGPNMNIKVARSSHSEDEVVENVLAVVESLDGVVPRKWKNVQVLSCCYFISTHQSEPPYCTRVRVLHSNRI